ncbi:Imm44 family immunity protein [Pasteurella atlantica]|uniref:Imm44 family immunity protein n=1 Tax=Pasteurellaceae TaxID=712 RepID=UPI0027470B1E|nr:Imm44 family immunity protein [Pasteurella atlantica]MDP8100097.1 Imm44 family immunity protein [Pasteurella atlantica]MDP8106224.1 Imm44 family immunity protein [Pasteurella atlantica]MDP8115953.1 Imm44 family immunity protein [Pasteurella atlantica]
MELWMSAECDLNIDKKEHFARNYVEDTINAEIESENYDIELDSWDCIIILMKDDPNYPERIRYYRKKRDMDFRLKIDSQKFENTDDLGRQRLIFEMLMRSLDLLEDRFKKASPKMDIKAFEELNRLRLNVIEVAKKENWLIDK